MNTKTRLGIGVLLCLAVSGCTSSSHPAMEPVRLEPRVLQPPMPEMCRLSSAVMARIQVDHIQPPAIDDVFSARVFDAMIAQSDPMKILLTQDDIVSLSKYKTHLDNEIDSGVIQFPWLLSELLSRRAEEFLLFGTQLIESHPDCSLGERFAANRGVVSFPKNEKEQRDLWTAFIKNELIRVRIARIITADSELWLPGFRTEDRYLQSLSEKDRVMNRLKMYVYSQRYPAQRSAAEIFLSAMTGAFDPHCSFNAPKEFARSQENLNLSFAGIGIQSSNTEGVFRVEWILPDGPAGRQGGLIAGDILLTVAEAGGIPVPLSGLPTAAVTDLIRGPKGTPVTFTVVNRANPTDSPRSVTLIRNDIERPEASSLGLRREIKQVDGGRNNIAIIRLPIFYKKPPAQNGHPRGASDEISKILNDFDDDGGVDGVILDLRSNPGGYLPEAVYVAGLFLQPGNPVVQVRHRDQKVRVLNTPEQEPFYDGPLIVLVNRFSGSASEVVAGALKDYGRALIVGDSETFGKGTIQQVIDMSQYSKQFGLPIPAGGLDLTVAKFYRINGETTQHRGISADIVIPSPLYAESIGERTIPNALPFDTIPPLKYPVWFSSVTPHISDLSARSEERTAQNPVFKELMQRKPASSVDSLWMVADFSKRLEEAYVECRRIQAKAVTQKEIVSQDISSPSSDLVLEETVAIMKDLIGKTHHQEGY